MSDFDKIVLIDKSESESEHDDRWYKKKVSEESIEEGEVSPSLCGESLVRA
jgi:hypothetical protein